MKKTTSAVWQGGLEGGKGTLSIGSGTLKDNPYGFNTRFEDTPGTNPEELTGTTHAGCFSMTPSTVLGETGLTIECIETHAEITLNGQSDGFIIAAVYLTLRTRVSGADAQTFEQIASRVKTDCPVSKVLSVKISLGASLDS